MNGAASLAQHLDDRSASILALWRVAVERDGRVPEAKSLTHQEFIDHIPELLDRLADRLRGRPASVIAAGKKHGRVRWRQGYDISELVKEIGHLRATLIQATFAKARDEGLDHEAVERLLGAINEVLDEATTESVAQYHETSTEATRAALAEVEQRKAAEESARVAAERGRATLRTILNHLPVGVWVADADGTVVAINREGERLQGFPEAEAVGRLNVHRTESYPKGAILHPDATVIPPEEYPLVRALRGETVTQQEVLWRNGDEPRSVMINAAPLTDPAGTVLGAVAVVQDISARKQMEVRLREQLDFTHAITNNLGKGVLATDRDGRVTFANPAAERLFGWPADELLGRNLHNLIHPRHADGSPFPIEECPIHGVVVTGVAVRGEDVFARRDGTHFPASFTSSPIVAGGTTAGAVMTFLDITESKHLQAQLAASEARFRTIAEQLPVMIWRSGPDGSRDYFNQSWCEFRGQPPESEAGWGWVEAIHDEDRDPFRAAYDAAVERREAFEVMYRMLRHDGQYRWLSERGAPYADAQGVHLGFLGSCTDITPRIELEASLEQQRAIAEESSRHKTRLLSALSHDARTPLNAVVLSAQLLEMHLRDAADPEVRQCLETIRHSVQNVLDLLGDLLNLSKIDAGVLPAEISQFELEPTLVECLASVEQQARLKGLEVQLDPNGLAGAVVETDRSKLKQILCNFLSNAFRYTERGHIRLYGERSADQIRISVEDTGVGIAPSDQSRIFDEFATLDHPRRAAGEGTGLGLAICRRLANLLQGEIELRSAPGEGSTFTLVLPATVLASVPHEARPAKAPQGPATGAIIVAEDHLGSRQALAKVLRRMGYRVQEASNGRDVLSLVRQERPVAILLDVNMPVMDGIETTLALRGDERFKDLPIFALTGDITLLNQRRISEAGVDGYLEKPITGNALRRVLDPLIRPAV